MEFNIENLQKCKTITECSKLLGYSYYNATVKEKLIQACESIGFDLWSHLENINKNKQKLCLNCGKPLNRRQHKFCCTSCSATYNNKIGNILQKQKKRFENLLLNTNKNILKFLLSL